MWDDVGSYSFTNPNTGYEEKFYNKIEAMVKARELNLSPKQIKWNFSDNVFSAIDWTTEPSTSLEELYKIRAQQIRDNYDYVLMFVSGGADSTNMLFAFLNNNIHLDEIVASAPISGLKDWERNNPSQDVRNTIEETFVSQMPFIQKLKNKFPNLNITLHDYFEDILNYKQDSWLIKGSDWIHPTMAGRYNLDRYTYLKRIAESGKKIAIVQGIDKPMLCRFKDDMAIVLCDISYNNKYNSVNHPNTYPVFFYHSPDLPQLMVKQSHVTARFLLRPENKEIYKAMPYNWEYAKFREDPFKNQRFGGLNGATYERGIVPAIYPWIKKWSFQADKPDKMFLGNHDHWFYQLHNKTNIWSMMKSDILNLYNTLGEKYFVRDSNSEITGFVQYFKTYKIGKVEKFSPKATILPDLPSSSKFEEMFN
jgi:hypothetical protein